MKRILFIIISALLTQLAIPIDAAQRRKTSAATAKNRKSLKAKRLALKRAAAQEAARKKAERVAKQKAARAAAQEAARKKAEHLARQKALADKKKKQRAKKTQRKKTAHKPRVAKKRRVKKHHAQPGKAKVAPVQLKDYIPANILQRMSTVQKNSITKLVQEEIAAGSDKNYIQRMVVDWNLRNMGLLKPANTPAPVKKAASADAKALADRHAHKAQPQEQFLKAFQGGVACAYEAIKNGDIIYNQLAESGRVSEKDLAKAGMAPDEWRLNFQNSRPPKISADQALGDALQPEPAHIDAIVRANRLLPHGNYTVIDNMNDLAAGGLRGTALIDMLKAIGESPHLREHINNIRNNANARQIFIINSPGHIFAVVVNKHNGALTYYFSDSDFTDFKDMHRNALMILKSLIEG